MTGIEAEDYLGLKCVSGAVKVYYSMACSKRFTVLQIALDI